MKEEITIPCCVACGSDKWNITEKWKGYQLAACLECGLIFTANPDYQAGRYIVAYEATPGEAPVPQEDAYVYAAPAERLRLEAEAFYSPAPRLTPPEKLALKWIIANAPKNALVIDCGCGSGRFQRALQRAGFQAVGVEVSAALVELLNRRGFRAVHGVAPDFPWDGRQPFAITFFEVLEHIPDPRDMIRRLKARFPMASIVASVPSPFRVSLLFYGQRGASDFPPNHFLRWTPKALESFFKKEGYSKVAIGVPPPIGSELMPGLAEILFKTVRFRSPASPRRSETADTGKQFSLLKRTKATAMVWTHRGYQVAMDFMGSAKAWAAARKGASAASMLVIAEP